MPLHDTCVGSIFRDVMNSKDRCLHVNRRVRISFGYAGVDIHRCGEDTGSKWMRQIEASENGTIYIPDFFPGQPLKVNEYLPNSDGDPKAVCPPSIKGGSSKITSRRELWTILVALVSAWLI